MTELVYYIIMAASFTNITSCAIINLDDHATVDLHQ